MRRAAFTLVEFMVLLGIVGVLLSLISASIMRAREAADRAACQSNMRQVALAVHQFHDDRRRPVQTALSWMVHLLPYMEQDSLYQQALKAQQVEPNTTINPPHTGASTVIRVYTCPTDSRLRQPRTDLDGFLTAFSSYIGVGASEAGLTDGVFYVSAASPLSFARVTDGLSNTLLLAERPPPDTYLAGRWYSVVYSNGLRYAAQRGPDHAMAAYYAQPVIIGGSNPDSCSGPFRFGPGRTENPCDRFHFWSLHTGGANFAFVDGSVRFLEYRAEPLMKALASVNGGETIEIPD